MKKQAVIVDNDLLEQVQYRKSTLPISFCLDHFNDFVNGEVNYHWHDEFEFAIVVKGEVEYSVHQINNKQEPVILREGEGVFVNTRALHMARQVKQGSVMSCFLFPASFFNFEPTGIVYKRNMLPIVRAPVSGVILKNDSAANKKILSDLHRFLELSPDMVGYELCCIEVISSIWRRLLVQFSEIRDFPVRNTKDMIQEQRLRLMMFIYSHELFRRHNNR
ncbi:cupin domain-containing protein [Lacrimispora sp.]|uniref:cupin domain-containing protein n=1 Tax=Lacrimispora sp. TaxID=2719234 RepID=UPI00289C7735|nr:AraC family ligand binding domain-containing protein [Lacrimispora sp.]